MELLELETAAHHPTISPEGENEKLAKLNGHFSFPKGDGFHKQGKAYE